MKLLLISDRECPYLYDHYQPGRLKDYDLILSCGDLKPDYLSFLVTMGRAPLLYVHGNHDGQYTVRPPEGCECIEDTVYTYQGLRILGLGGSPHYNGGPHQYTEQQMARRIRRLNWKIRRAGGVDIILSHAAHAGAEGTDSYAHRGFQCFLPLIERWQPRYFIHGHIHMNYGHAMPRTALCGTTTVVNAYERFELEL